MDVDVRELGGSRVVLHMKLSADEVSGAFDRTYQELSDRGGIRGFRPGKIPRKLLDRNYGRDVIRGIAYETMVNDRLEEAIQEENLRPLDQVEIEVGEPPDEDEVLAETIKSGLVRDEEDEEPSEAEEPEEEPEGAEDVEDALEDVPIEEGEPFEFYTVFTTYPRPRLPELDALELQRPVAEVSQGEVNEQVQRLRRLNAEEIEVEREEIADGDLVVADTKVLVGDEDPDEVEATEQEIVIGERDYLGDLDEALIGHRVGDELELQFEYDEDHPDPELAGQSGRIRAEVKSFVARELPEVNDEFARSLGDYEGLEDLYASIREQLQARHDEWAHEELRGQVIRHIIEETEVSLPERFVEEAADRSLEDLRAELQQVGMSVSEFADASDVDEEELRENQRARAVGGLKLVFALEALAEQRDVEVTEEDLAEELRRIADDSGGDMEFVQQAAALQPNFAEDVHDRALRRKVIDDVVAHAEIEDVPEDIYRAATEGVEAAEQAGEVAEVPDAEIADGAVEAQETAVADEADEAHTSNQETIDAEEASQESEKQ